MKITVENMISYKVFYIRHTGAYGAANIETMNSLKKWAKLNNLYNENSIILGIALDNPETTKPENCRYDACLIAGEDFLLDKYYSNESSTFPNNTIAKDMSDSENNTPAKDTIEKIDNCDVKERTITGGKYAVFEIDHTPAAVQEAWANIFPALAECKYQFDPARPIIERYAVKMVNNHLCEICVPIC